MRPKKISLPASDLVASCLERLGSVRREPAHTVLFERGDPVQGVYLVISGKVELSLGTTVSRLLNRILGSGEIAGLPAALSGEPYSRDRDHARSLRAVVRSARDILKALKNDPPFGVALLEMLAHEVRELREIWRDAHDGAAASRQ
jgi:CRP/FNR family transcriptional regulator, cyclic AMP receptor protein